jgi:hypothetical protein
MANGLKGRAIAFTASGNKILTITGASKITLQLPASGASLWTASQQAAAVAAAAPSAPSPGAYRQPFVGAQMLTMDSYSKQQSSEIFEPVHIALTNNTALYGFIWGQAATWTTADDS